MQSLEFQKKGAFKSPPKEWIDHRLENFYETLNKNTKSSALALKDLLGPIEMEPVQSDPIIENGHIIEQKPPLPGSFKYRISCPIRSREQRYELV